MMVDKIDVIWIDDDEELIQNCINEFIDNNINILPSYTISEGLKRIMNGEANNVILDIAFPGNSKEGIVFLKEIKKIIPNLNVVLFTGNHEEEEKVQLLKSEVAIDYISKPFPLTAKENNNFFTRLKQNFSQPNSVKSFRKQKLEKLIHALEEYQIPVFINIFKSIFANLSYDIKIQESYFHSFIHLILDLIGIHIESEVQTNNGRIDSVIKTEEFIYVVEFKFENNKGLNQIIEKKYYEKYLADNREIILLALNFNKNTKNIDTYKYIKLNKNNEH